MNSSQIVIEAFHSQALEGNPLGDPATRRVPVYLPPDYDEGRRYPSLYLLAAFAARGLKLLNDDLWEENIQERLDRLIAEGAVRPIIVVLPDASTRYGGSQYLNSSATGNYEDHILELVNHIDSHYPTQAEAGQRAVAGHSSGGYAALRLAMRHPKTFGLAASHSGDLFFDLVYQPEFGDFLRYYERVGDEGIRELLADPGAALNSGAPFPALNLAAMASCYSPNPDAAWGFDLPFDLKSGQLRPEVWARWKAQDPVEMAAEHADALRSLQLLYFDCGRFDEYNLLYGARLLAERLTDLKVPFDYEEFDGGHRNIRFRYDTSLSKISDALS